MVRVDATKMEEMEGMKRAEDHNIIQERENIDTERNEAYGHFDGGERRKEHSTEADVEYQYTYFRFGCLSNLFTSYFRHALA